MLYLAGGPRPYSKRVAESGRETSCFKKNCLLSKFKQGGKAPFSMPATLVPLTGFLRVGACRQIVDSNEISPFTKGILRTVREGTFVLLSVNVCEWVESYVIWEDSNWNRAHLLSRVIKAVRCKILIVFIWFFYTFTCIASLDQDTLYVGFLLTYRQFTIKLTTFAVQAKISRTFSTF